MATQAALETQNPTAADLFEAAYKAFFGTGNPGPSAAPLPQHREVGETVE
jgi:hypothetical protein